MLSSDQLVFGPFHIDVADERLRREREVIPLKPKTFALLRYLIEHPGRLITKEELLNVLWADVRVGSAVVKVCIREIREALGDPAKTPQYIETVARRGYRFIAAVTAVPVPSSEFRVPSSFPPPAPSSQRPPPTLVGREVELTKLHRLLDTALDGERQIVFVTGEAGIGKTTLVETFLQQIAGRADLWLAGGHCLEQYGEGEAYLPVLEAFGHLCREPRQEGMKEVLSQYAPTWMLQMPAVLSGTDLEALQRRTVGATNERMLREVAEALEALTITRGLVLWFDDVHWSDYSTLDLISYLARRSQPARLSVICTYRPAEAIIRDHPLKTIKQDLQLHHYCEELSLAFLTEVAVEEYLATRFSSSGIAARLTPIIHRRTEGNPLFMVNMVDHLVAQKVVVQQDGQWELAGEVMETDVPTSLRAFIEQQIEQVTPEAQQVLEAGSVMGMTFSAAVVAAGINMAVGEVEKICEGLVRQVRFLQRKGTEEWPDGTVAACYGFVHALYQQTLAERVLPGHRVELHRRIGERLETAYGTRAGDLAAELALHFEHGRDYQRAVQYRWQAGENALRRHAHHEAINHVTKALELLRNLPATLERSQQELLLQITLGGSMIASKGHAAPEVEQTYARALVLCQEGGETPQLFPALAGLYRFHVVRAEYNTASELAEQLLRLAQDAHDRTLLMAAHGMLGYTLFFHGELGAAQSHLEQSIALYDLQQDRFFALLYGDDAGVASLSFLAWTLWLRGYPDQALQRTHEALSLAQELSHPHVCTTALGLATQLYRFCRKVPAVQEHADATLALATAQGFPLWVAVGTIFRGWALAEQGAVEEGITQIDRGLTALRTTGSEAERPHYLALLAEACGKEGRIQDGLFLVEEALATVDKTGEQLWAAELYRLYGELSLRLGERASERTGEKVFIAPSPIRLVALSSPETCFLKAIEIARQQQAKSLELRAVMSLVRLRQHQAQQHETRTRLDEAHTMLSEIYGWFTEGFETKDLQEAKALLD